MLTQIRNLACQLKRQNAEIEFAIHRNRADKLERPASWNANPNSYKASRTDLGGVVMIQSNWLRSVFCGISMSKYVARAGRVVAMPKSNHAKKTQATAPPQRWE